MYLIKIEILSSPLASKSCQLRYPAQFTCTYHSVMEISFSLHARIRLTRWLSGKKSTCQYRRHRFNPWVRKIPWSRKWQATLVFLPGKFHGQSSLEEPGGHGVTESRTRLCNWEHQEFKRQATVTKWQLVFIMRLQPPLWPLAFSSRLTCRHVSVTSPPQVLPFDSSYSYNSTV